MKKLSDIEQKTVILQIGEYTNAKSALIVLYPLSVLDQNLDAVQE